MKLKDYLKDKLLDAVLLACVLVFIFYLLSILQIGGYAIVFVEGLFLLVCFIIFIRNYCKKKYFYSELADYLEQLDKKFLIADMIERPDFFEGNMLYDVLQETCKSMNDEIAAYRISEKEYKEYIEIWIHEVKTPIAATELIIKNNENEVTGSISEEIEKIDYYLEQALYYARSSSVEKDYIIKRIAICDIVNGVIRKNSKFLIRQKIQIVIGDLEGEVFTDVKWMDFILNQIIINAVKYKKEQGSIHIYKQENRNSTSLFIKDNGIGINGSDLPKVMEKGYTGNTGRKYAKSTGMGLYLCSNLCIKMGLSFQITSKEGEYTIVEIVFPKHRAMM